MAYYTNLFSPETFEAYKRSDKGISGFRMRQENAAKQIEPGDKLICYLTKLSRWFAVFEVKSKYFIDDTPIFYPEDDPFKIRFNVIPIVLLPVEKAVPIREDNIFNKLSFTKGHDPKGSLWTGKLRNSLNKLSDKDGLFLEDILAKQIKNGIIYDYDQDEYRRLSSQQLRRPDKIVSVTVPQEEDYDNHEDEHSIRDSYRIQALIAQIGEKMGFKIWLPKRDRSNVLKEWTPNGNNLLEHLPLNYNEVTLNTIEQIDVLWLNRQAIARAFEVEHTTSIYSGILRMADLLALLPNMDIKLHIVAPYERRDKVFREIRRPVFSLLDKAPLSEVCTFISYDSLEELFKDKHLGHMSDSVIDEYAEEPE